MARLNRFATVALMILGLFAPLDPAQAQGEVDLARVHTAADLQTEHTQGRFSWMSAPYLSPKQASRLVRQSR